MVVIGPAPQPSDVNDGRGWLVSFDDGVAHHVQIGGNSLMTGIPRSFAADGDTHALPIGSPQTVSFEIAGRSATLTRRWDREGVGSFLRRYFRSFKLFVPGMQQRHLRFSYTLDVEEAAGGTWVADMPNNVLHAWLFRPGAGGGDPAGASIGDD